MAPQAAPHRRGGTHRVKDADKTNTIFDDYDYKLLKAECIARGVYVKDMKKVEMAKTLAKNEREKKEAEREAIRERAREQQRLEREKQEENDRRLKADAVKHRRRMEREAKRANDENVSDTTPDEDEIQAMYEMYEDNSENADQGPAGWALSEESWDSTSTESSYHSMNRADLPDCKLRLFEWSYMEPPSPVKRSVFDPEPVETPARRGVGVRMWVGTDEVDPKTCALLPSPTAEGQREPPIPRHVPYAPLKVLTTYTSEKLFFPGQTYPPGVDADYVPVLSERTRHAARSGVLEGVLRKASIEPAAYWVDRTQIQGWNARMFFHLPPRNEQKQLKDVYEKWYLESRNLLRVKPLGDGSALTRKQRHDQRHKNKGKKQADVLDASEYRVPAVCYLPAYLDYSIDAESVEEALQHEEHRFENLFYIRFPGCDVPHYYFWARKGEWADPTTPNPAWTPEVAEREIKQRVKVTPRSRLAGKSLPKPPLPPRQLLVRGKKPVNLPPSPSPSGSPTYATITSRIEHDIYTHGLSSTLAKYRAKWLARGNDHAWQIFGRALPSLYPSGEIPSAPPVHPAGKMCVAEKLAHIEHLRQINVVFPFRGDEPWTKHDDEWWDVVDATNTCDEDDDEEAHDYAPLKPSELEPLYRRASVQSPLVRRACEKWVAQVSPSDVPLTPGSMSDSPACMQEEWEERFLADQRRIRGLDVVCPFCLGGLGDLGMEEQAAHIYAHSARKEEEKCLRVALPSQRTNWMTTKRSEMIDAGAEADAEPSPTTKPRRTKRKHSDPSLPDLDSLHFLTAYGGTKPGNSLSVHVGAPKKRRKVSDPTYRDGPASPDSDDSYASPPVVKNKTKKRKRIADPLFPFRIPSQHAASSEDEYKDDLGSTAPIKKKTKKKDRKSQNITTDLQIELRPVHAPVPSRAHHVLSGNEALSAGQDDDEARVEEASPCAKGKRSCVVL
ncbi:hypothetical protein BDU57DRAFT_333157 [Ampelomyces quisqualis]|uniref:Uncharacterized protein n=1 Tax=Ampelomyces quisqualis TaxID=50730 RepID=A0A6A5QEK2_AMPQU|nr:hypothetical protein BDU57DRAFT_333157 [Ampelomyces quisqualis]